MVPTSFRQTIGLSPSTVSLSSTTKSALIIIDSQGTYAPGAPLEISNFNSSQAAMLKAINLYRNANSPVIFIQHSAGAGAPIFNPSDENSFGFVGEVKPKEGEKVIIKQAPSSFTGTDLDEELKKLGVTQIVLTGYMSHVCVTGTARAGMEGGCKLYRFVLLLPFPYSFSRFPSIFTN